LAKKHWDDSMSIKYIKFFKNTLVSTNLSVCDSLKFHCASLWLDELDNAGKMDKETCLKFIQPYIDLLKENMS
jgi:hypothetical protein